MIEIYTSVENHPAFYKKIWFVLSLIESFRDVRFVPVDQRNDASLVIGSDTDSDVVVSVSFYDMLDIGIFDHRSHFPDEALIKTNSGEPDRLSTIFYLVNAIQEYDAPDSDTDQLGRFRYESSLQYRFGLIHRNYVVELADEFLKSTGYPTAVKSKPAQIGISHDIDLLTSGFKQEFLFALKKGNWKKAFSFLRQKLAGQSPWNNVTAIGKLDSGFGLSAIFFWLPVKDKHNADYLLDSPSVLEDIRILADLGHRHGLHKSTHTTSLRKERSELPFSTNKNRYHFLKFTLPAAWNEIESSGIEADYSMGYPRQTGMRNSFGLPFTPYNLELDRPYSFTVHPLHVMDVGLDTYASKNRHAVVKEIADYLNLHKNDAEINILWHNNNLTPHSNNYLLEAYSDVMDILKEDNRI